MREVHCETVGSRLPRRVLGTRNLAFPFEHVGGAVGIGDWLGYETEGMFETPLLSLLFESIHYQFVHLIFLSHLKSANYYSKLIYIYTVRTKGLE